MKYIGLFIATIFAVFGAVFILVTVLADPVLAQEAVAAAPSGAAGWLTFILANLPAIIAALGTTLGGAVGIASAWVLITPSPHDDEAVGKFREFVERFSLFFPQEGVGERPILDDEE